MTPDQQLAGLIYGAVKRTRGQLPPKPPWAKPIDLRWDTNYRLEGKNDNFWKGWLGGAQQYAHQPGRGPLVRPAAIAAAAPPQLPIGAPPPGGGVPSGLVADPNVERAQFLLAHGPRRY